MHLPSIPVRHWINIRFPLLRYSSRQLVSYMTRESFDDTCVRTLSFVKFRKIRSIFISFESFVSKLETPFWRTGILAANSLEGGKLCIRRKLAETRESTSKHLTPLTKTGLQTVRINVDFAALGGVRERN